MKIRSLLEHILHALPKEKYSGVSSSTEREKEMPVRGVSINYLLTAVEEQSRCRKLMGSSWDSPILMHASLTFNL